MRVVVTGMASDFGTAIAPVLCDDPEVGSVVGVDLREPRAEHPKLTFEREDVRSPRMEEIFAGADAVVHLAYIVGEIHDREMIHDVNLGGSKNVLHAAHAAGVKRLVVASSVSAYGAHESLPGPLDEAEFPRGNPDKYYYYDKAEVEHYIEWWERRNPKAKLTVTRLRPPTLVGPSITNDLVKLLAAEVSVFPKPAHPFQFLHQRDLAAAFHKAVKADLPGPLNIAPDDSLDIGLMAKLHGQKLIRVPHALARTVMNAAFRLHLSPDSGQWISTGDPVVNSDRAHKELDWRPEFSSVECAQILLMQAGRPILPGRGRRADGEPVMKRKAVAEATLEPLTSTIKEWVTEVEGLGASIGDPQEVDRFVDHLEHEFIFHKDKAVHIEVHPADKPTATVVFSPGLGAHARFYLPLFGKLCDAGVNVIAIDRPGHGLSEGRRGDCSFQETLDVVELAIRYGRDRFAGPLVLTGSSLGGIITWFALTREPDIDLAICHNIAHPEVFHEPAMRRKAPLLKSVGKLAPHLSLPIEQLADFDAVTQSPAISKWFADRHDKLFAWKVSASAATGLLAYAPPVDWSQVTIPTVVLVGEDDQMVSREFTERVLARAQPVGTELRILPGMGHLVYHDHLAESLPVLLDCIETKVAAEREPTLAG